MSILPKLNFFRSNMRSSVWILRTADSTISLKSGQLWLLLVSQRTIDLAEYYSCLWINSHLWFFFLLLLLFNYALDPSKVFIFLGFPFVNWLSHLERMFSLFQAFIFEWLFLLGDCWFSKGPYYCVDNDGAMSVLSRGIFYISQFFGVSWYCQRTFNILCTMLRKTTNLCWYG